MVSISKELQQTVKGLRLHELSNLLGESGVGKPELTTTAVFEHMYRKQLPHKSIASMEDSIPRGRKEAIEFLLLCRFSSQEVQL